MSANSFLKQNVDQLLNTEKAISILTSFMGMYGQLTRDCEFSVGKINLVGFIFACFAHFLTGVIADSGLCAFLMICEGFSAIFYSIGLVHGFSCQKMARSTNLNIRFLIVYLLITTIIHKPGNVECGVRFEVTFTKSDEGMHFYEYDGYHLQFTKLNGFPCTNASDRGFPIFDGCVPIIDATGDVSQLTKEDFDRFDNGTLAGQIYAYWYDRIRLLKINIVFQPVKGSLENSIFEIVNFDSISFEGAFEAIHNSNLTEYLLYNSKIALTKPTKILGYSSVLFWKPYQIADDIRGKFFIYNGFYSVDGPDVRELFKQVENLTNNNYQLAANIGDLTSKNDALIETNSNLSNKINEKDHKISGINSRNTSLIKQNKQQINRLNFGNDNLSDEIKQKDTLLKEAIQSKKIVVAALIAIIVVLIIVILVGSICFCREKCCYDQSCQSTAGYQRSVQQNAQNNAQNKANFPRYE